ncbi:MAG: hypothetical protein CVV64_16640 [Candidatus Wallbacteria bacterium HGW-Wallbacteria-1]|jgi:hypothetical protein|uniref:Nitrile hydratase alpha/Thiocyanate hydrolase gamma domain-containing protein n=1 Tax=Candidatus Wallbacteria bacterium HGW-Wallbacteria-1 TaxID=2013854 RepID=A0A2N1PKS4_9BACT|nr:MAG: hypothetical protein CVV64_16640 [Candidatus Wallbacteria bacterium HGW-Wallbacteria-1]
MEANFLVRLVNDRDFRKKFMDSPSEMLSAEGMTEYDGKKIIIHENSNVSLNFCLLPKGFDLSILKNLDPRFIKIQEKVWTDNEFKEKILTNAKKTLSEFFTNIPEKMDINIFENNASTFHIVLPSLKMESDELDDNDLEMVAGGKGDIIETITDLGESFVDYVTPGVNSLVSFSTDAIETSHDFFYHQILYPALDVQGKVMKTITDPVEDARNKSTCWAVGW